MKKNKLLSVLSLGIVAVLTACSSNVDAEVALERTTKAVQKTTTEAPGLEVDFSTEFKLSSSSTYEGVTSEMSANGEFNIVGKISFDHENNDFKGSLETNVGLDFTTKEANEEVKIGLDLNGNIYTTTEKLFLGASYSVQQGEQKNEDSIKGYLDYAELESLFSSLMDDNTSFSRKALDESEEALIDAETMAMLDMLGDFSAKEGMDGKLTTKYHVSNKTVKAGVKEMVEAELGDLADKMDKETIDQLVNESLKEFLPEGLDLDVTLSLIVGKDGYLAGFNTDLKISLATEESSFSLELSEKLSIKTKEVDVTIPDTTEYSVNILESMPGA